MSLEAAASFQLILALTRLFLLTNSSAGGIIQKT